MLVEAALKTDLLAVFMEAKDTPMTEEIYAGKLAKVITDYIKTAGIPSGSVIISVSGGSGAPAVGMPNTTAITVT
jgi:hypothetical protein